MQKTIETIDVNGSSMEVFLFRPDGEGPHAAVLLAQHIPMGHAGIENDEFTLNAAERIADKGYFVAVPFIFHWWPKDAEMDIKREESRDDWTLADLHAAFDLMSRRDDVDNKRIGIVGHCWGGRVAWLGACHIPDFRLCVMFYGGNIKTPRGEGNPAPMDMVGQITCPVIGIFGNEDQNPSPEDVDDLDKALSNAGVFHVFHRYDGAGHAFQCFTMPERYREEQSEDAWGKLFGYLEQYL
ncbi:MAG: dienelactone hydrolase family protein [Gammaproteobacteria bacterium]